MKTAFTMAPKQAPSATTRTGWAAARGMMAALAASTALALGAGAPATASTGLFLDAGVAPTRPYASWFRIGRDAAELWSVEGSLADPHLVQVALRAQRDGDADDRPHVMVLYPKPSSAYDTAITKILTMFESRGVDAEFSAFNFRDKDDEGQRALDYAAENGVDLIFSMGSQSTAWLWDNYRGGDIPVVSVTSKDPVMLGQAENYDHGTGTNFAFTSLNMPVSAQLAYVNQLRPRLKNLAVLVDSKNISAVETQARPIIEMAAARGVRTLSLEVQDPKNAREELVELVSKAVETMRLNDVTLENSLFWITGSTSIFREIATINAHSDRAPVLSVVPEVVGEGDDSAALSIGISFESNAHLAAIYAIRVLEGEIRAGALPVGVVSPPDIAINFRRVRDIGLSVPFSFVEGAGFIYDYDGVAVRHRGVNKRKDQE